MYWYFFLGNCPEKINESVIFLQRTWVPELVATGTRTGLNYKKSRNKSTYYKK